MNRYEAVLSGRDGKFAATLLCESPLKKGCEVKLRGSDHKITTILPADDQRPHLGDTIIKPPKK